MRQCDGGFLFFLRILGIPLEMLPEMMAPAFWASRKGGRMMADDGGPESVMIMVDFPFVFMQILALRPRQDDGGFQTFLFPNTLQHFQCI